MISAEFVTAGKAIFTVEPSQEAIKAGLRTHYTYKVRLSKDGRVFFVSYMTGNDNENHYSYMGILRTEHRDGGVYPTAGSKVGGKALEIVSRVLRRVFAGEGAMIENAGWKVRHSGKCGRCGRTLTTPESLECGIGPECRKNLA